MYDRKKANIMTQDDVIKEQIELLIDDIKIAYEKSGKKVSGEFAKGLEGRYYPDGADLYGYTYLAGRKAGKMPPVEAIKKWIIAKGIKPFKDNITTTSLAWAIAKKIAKQGTNKDYHYKIYQDVITPERIDEIIQKVAVFNVDYFVNQLTAQLEILEKDK